MVMLSPEDVTAAKPVLTLTIIVAFLLSALIIGAGVIALQMSASSQSVINAFGLSVTTGNVAVALIALGAVTAIVVLKRVLDVVAQLAKLK